MYASVFLILSYAVGMEKSYFIPFDLYKTIVHAIRLQNEYAHWAATFIGGFRMISLERTSIP